MRLGTLDLNIDRSVYYSVDDILTREGFVNASGDPLITVLDYDIVHLLQENVDEQYAEITGLSGVQLPVVSIISPSLVSSAGALGGVHWEARNYRIAVFGRNPAEATEIAGVIYDAIASGIYVYDYTMALPTASGFPLSGQFAGRFDVNKRRIMRIPSPVPSNIDAIRKEVIFEVKNLR